MRTTFEIPGFMAEPLVAIFTKLAVLVLMNCWTGILYSGKSLLKWPNMLLCLMLGGCL